MLAIVIPYCKLMFFEATLDSLANQTDKRFKVYIGDDDSPENPIKLLNNYQGKFEYVYHRFEHNFSAKMLIKQWSPCIVLSTKEIAATWVAKDKRFKYIYKQNGGLSSARNAGIAAAVGEFILPLDADDKIGKDYIALALPEFDKNADVKVVYCRAEKFGMESGEWILSDFDLKTLATQNMIFCSGIYRKKCWIEAGGYDTNMIYGLEDWEFWIAILKNGRNVKRLDEICFFYRVKENSMAQDLKIEERNNHESYVLTKHFVFIQFVLKQYRRDLICSREISKSRKNAINVLLQVFGFRPFAI